MVLVFGPIQLRISAVEPIAMNRPSKPMATASTTESSGSTVNILPLTKITSALGPSGRTTALTARLSVAIQISAATKTTAIRKKERLFTRHTSLDSIGEDPIGRVSIPASGREIQRGPVVNVKRGVALFGGQIVATDAKGVGDSIDVVEPRGNQSDLQNAAVVEAHGPQRLVI